MSTRREQVREFETVRACYFDLPLDTNVPNYDVVEQCPVLDFEIVVPGRQECVVVYGVGATSVTVGRFKKGRAAQTGTALNGGHIEKFGHVNFLGFYAVGRNQPHTTALEHAGQDEVGPSTLSLRLLPGTERKSGRTWETAG